MVTAIPRLVSPVCNDDTEEKQRRLPAGERAGRSGESDCCGPAPLPHLGRLLQVGREGFPGDERQVEGRHHVRLGEVQPPRLGEEVRLPLNEPRVVERRRQVDLRAEHRPPVDLRHHGRALQQATPLTCQRSEVRGQVLILIAEPLLLLIGYCF